MQPLKDFSLSKRFPEFPVIGAAFSSNQPNTIPLSFGFPAPESFPISLMQESAVAALQTQGTECLQYTGGLGQHKVTQWIKQRSKLRSIDVKESNIIVTTGSMQGIDLATRTLTNPGDSVWVEAPCFFGALRSFRMAEVQLSSFPIDENGLRVDLVEEALKEAKRTNKPLPKMLYVMPNYHNPGGIILSLERRKKLAELAYEYNFYILEDDAYVELSFSNEYLPSIFSFGPERVIYLSTFSKIIAPGIRMGWAIAGEHVIDKMKILKPDGLTSVFVQEVVHQLLDKANFDEHLKGIITLYERRRNAMVEAIRTYFQGHVSFSVPEGGFFLWLTFPEEVDTGILLLDTLKHGVSFIEGSHFYLEHGPSNHIRLCFTYCDEEQIWKGIKQLADSYFAYQKSVPVYEEV